MAGSMFSFLKIIGIHVPEILDRSIAINKAAPVQKEIEKDINIVCCLKKYRYRPIKINDNMPNNKPLHRPTLASFRISLIFYLNSICSSINTLIVIAKD